MFNGGDIMDKKFSKLFLVFLLVAIIFLGISLVIVSKEKVDIDDILGDRTYLEDMTIVYQKNKGIFQTNEIRITKDKESVDSFVKEASREFGLSKEDIENRDIYQLVDERSNVCTTENEIVNVSLYNSDSLFNKEEMVAYVEVKNKKTNKIDEYEILINDEIDAYGNSIYKAIPIRYKDTIYLAVMSSIYNEDTYDDSSSSPQDYYSQSYLSLYKLNSTTKKSKFVLRKSYASNDIYMENYLGFSHNNTTYFIINEKNKETNRYETSLFAFDVISKEINIINLGINNSSIDNYYIDGDEVLLSSSSSSEKENVVALIVDLNKKEVKQKNEVSVKKQNDLYSNVVALNRYNGKIYLILGNYSYDDYIDVASQSSETNYYIYIIDEKLNDILYKGRIKDNTVYDLKFSILKKDEL